MSKANQRLYFLRRLKKFGASTETLKEVYCLFVRSILEFCTPLWAGNLTKKCVRMLNRVEQSAFKIIFPHKTYDQSADNLKMQKLANRRFFITRRFAKRMSKMNKFAYLFPKKDKQRTRGAGKFHIPKSFSNRHKFSSIPVFLRILNGEKEDVVFKNC